MLIRTLSVGALALAACVLGCKSGSDPTPGQPASSAAPAASAQPESSTQPGSSAQPASTGLVTGVPIPPELVAKVVNPKGEEPYKGPTGTLKGVVRIAGDPPLPMDFTFPSGCGEAAATYGKLFRAGQDGTLADVMVAVTGYKGYVPPRDPAEKMTIHGCALAKRTMAVAFGQRVEIANIDKTESYMPYLEGAPFRAILVAMPGGEAVRFYPNQPGHYLIKDQLPKPYLTADVYVVAYATHDVTGLDGQFEIPDIPVGKVKATAFLPAIDKVVEKELEIKAGDNTVDFTIEFNRAEYDQRRAGPKPSGSTAPSAGPSAAPSASASAGPKG